eukprot:SAG25_NODE_11258_length_309_cov_1.171429_1_plen_68_part_01
MGWPSRQEGARPIGRPPIHDRMTQIGTGTDMLTKKSLGEIEYLLRGTSISTSIAKHRQFSVNPELVLI